MSLRSPRPGHKGASDILEPPKAGIVPAHPTACISKSPIPVKPNVPHLNEVALLHDGVTAPFGLAPLATPHVARARE